MRLIAGIAPNRIRITARQAIRSGISCIIIPGLIIVIATIGASTPTVIIAHMIGAGSIIETGAANTVMSVTTGASMNVNADAANWPSVASQIDATVITTANPTDTVTTSHASARKAAGFARNCLEIADPHGSTASPSPKG